MDFPYYTDYTDYNKVSLKYYNRKVWKTIIKKYTKIAKEFVIRKMTYIIFVRL